MLQSHGDGETGGRGDWGTGRKFSLVAPSPRRPVAPSFRLCGSLALWLCVSVANSSAQEQSAPVQSPPVINNPAALFTEALAGAGYLAVEILAIEDPAARDAVLRK